MKIFVVLTLAFAAASVYGGVTDGVLDQAVKFLDGCGSSDLSLCFKERALRMVDNLPQDVEIAEGVHVKQTESNRMAKQYNGPVALPEEPQARELAVDSALFNKALEYMGGSTIEIKMPKDSMDDIKRSFEESRSKKKAKKILLPLLLLFKLKAATLIPLALGTIALIAFKALAIGKLALIISAVIGIKKLLDDKHHHAPSYEVVSHDEHHGRSFSEDAQKLAYRGQL